MTTQKPVYDDDPPRLPGAAAIIAVALLAFCVAFGIGACKLVLWLLPAS